ncbi:spore germination protein [Brevibacillus reuszeri]|uniref:Spore germination protein n=1 Tax=Brevibacillus reuszeri TaxID=54915 RepID=A0ABQ0TM09_9BACL|nr:spore germination protein [Brevibacillus reuszeri]MED1858076.1 spore germination protein [Brevibacillus reuszeri]GED68932.1 spore germination protein [Brevibacillus reuszeri]
MKNRRFSRVKGLIASPLTSPTDDTEELDTLRVEAFEALFDGCHDVTIEAHTLRVPPQPLRVHLIYAGGICDLDRISEYLMPQLVHLFQNEEIHTAYDLSEKRLFFMNELVEPKNVNLICREVFAGHLLLLFESFQTVYFIQTSNPPQRDPEESNTDVSIRGPRDGFTEELTTNLALIRKRLKTYQLKYTPYIVGTHTHTNIGLLYLKDQIDPQLVQQISGRISSLDSKGIVSGLQIEEKLARTPLTLLPEYQYTGRPDYVVSALLKGRFALLIDGSPTALIGPANFFMLLNAAEDTNTSLFSIAFVRMLRLTCVFIALFLPGFWIALVIYHQEQLPYTLIATIVKSRQGVPLPAALEVLLMVLLFELFKEAGLRLPLAIGQTLSVVGGLIVGQAAIAAGLTSSGSLVIVALSVMATFTLTNQHMVGTVTLLRIGIFLVCSLLGMFGFMISLIATLLYFSNMRSFGLYYLAPVAPTMWSDLLKILFRTPWRKAENKPQMLANPSEKKKGT